MTWSSTQGSSYPQRCKACICVYAYDPESRAWTASTLIGKSRFISVHLESSHDENIEEVKQPRITSAGITAWSSRWRSSCNIPHMWRNQERLGAGGWECSRLKASSPHVTRWKPKGKHFDVNLNLRGLTVIVVINEANVSWQVTGFGIWLAWIFNCVQSHSRLHCLLVWESAHSSSILCCAAHP